MEAEANVSTRDDQKANIHMVLSINHRPVAPALLLHGLKYGPAAAAFPSLARGHIGQYCS
jgi:hypothetical protein